MEIEIESGEAVSLTEPPEPINAQSIVLGATGDEPGFVLGLNVNGQGFQITIPVTVTLTEENGTYDATVSIYSFGTSYTDPLGIVYDLTIGTDFLFCLTPEPPQGWMNLQVTCDMSVTIGDISTSVSFSEVVPLVSVEEEGA
jgi:hypothetical protein